MKEVEMYTQIVQDVVVIGGMFLLRIVLPLLIVMGVGGLIQRWLEPKATHEQFEAIVRTAQEQVAQPVEAAVQLKK
jgi:Na+-transporting methylmalonyl-CoA/oxaloacetate decarboxylase gamma subunit